MSEKTTPATADESAPDPVASHPDPATATDAAADTEAASAEAKPATPEPAQSSRPQPKPSAPSIPSPAALAATLRPRPRPPVPPAPSASSDSARFGRVEPDGRVFVRVGEEEREVGSYPGVTPEEALQYFARKFDELAGSAELVRQRLANPEVPAKEAADGLATLKEHIATAHVVGDLGALQATVSEIAAQLETKRAAEAADRAAARAAAAAAREALVAEAERISAQPPTSTQWKQSGERMRTLLEDWKRQQRSGPKIDKGTESALWQRFSHARNAFDKARRTWFAQLDVTHAEAKKDKQRLVAEAEHLATSKDWTSTARAFKDLMGQWRRAGRASRADDDALWERFKAAQDAFFAAKDEVTAAEDAQFRTNLAVKESLLTEAAGILPVTDLEAAKSALRVIQDKWDKAGKVPRADMERTEKGLRRVESAVREAEDRRWSSTNPEAAARARSLAEQLETSVVALRTEVEAAQQAGNERKAGEAAARLATQEEWLRQARAGLDEFSG